MSERADKLRRLASGAGWYHPFFLPPLSQVTFTERTDMPETMMIDPEGNLYFHPKDFDRLGDAERAGSVFHELMHPLSRHAQRRGERKQGLWNIAADMTINQFLRTCNVKLPADVYYPPSGMEDLSAESIYDRLKDDPEWQKKGAAAEAAIGVNGKGTPGVGKGCGCQPSKDGSVGGEKEVDWAKAAAQASAQARKAGQGKGDAFIKVLLGRPPGIDWGRYVKGVAQQALSSHGRDQQTMSRRNRRSPQNIIYPGWMAVRARVCVVIDTSGSVSDAMLARAIVHAVALGQVSGLRVFLVIHDDGVQWAGWLAGVTPDKVMRTFRGRGGTNAHEAYRRVAQERTTFDALVHLTDGELSWPEKPANVRKMIAAIYGGEQGSRGWCEPPKGTTIVPVEV
jgi:predicted metal-dependent peptidase